MNQPVSNTVLRDLIADLEEGIRLKTLTNEELVNEYFVAEDDELIVMEMCKRLSPGITEAQGH
jgi:hypothetical protein